MTDWINRLKPKSSFARGVGVLVGGTASAQLLALLAAPILTRLYTPDDFGMLAVYASLLGLTTVIASLRYELAIPLPEEDTEAANLAALSLILVGITTVLAGVMTFVLREPISTALNLPELKEYLWLLPVGTLTVGIYNIFNYWAVRKKQFRSIAVTRITQSSTTLLVNLAAFKWGGSGLLMGQVIGQSAGSLKLGKIALLSSSFRDVSWEGIRQAAIRYKKFPYFSTGEGLANTVGLQIPPILLTIQYGAIATGFFALANRVLSLPLTLIGGAIGQLFFSRAAEANRKGELAKLVEKLHSHLAYIGLPPALLIASFGAKLFAFIFGENWSTAGELAQWMSPWLYLVFVSSPLSTLFSVVEKQGHGLVFQILLLSMRLLALYYGFLSESLVNTIILYSLASAICYIGLLVWFSRMVRLEVVKLIYPTVISFLLSVMCLSPIIINHYSLIKSDFLFSLALTLSIIFIVIYYNIILRRLNVDG